VTFLCALCVLCGFLPRVGITTEDTENTEDRNWPEREESPAWCQGIPPTSLWTARPAYVPLVAVVTEVSVTVAVVAVVPVVSVV
jgi:hypothetical protein